MTFLSAPLEVFETDIVSEVSFVCAPAKNAGGNKSNTEIV
jgi:hypothetical protein